MLMVHRHNLKRCRSVFIFVVIWFLAPGAATQAQPKADPKGAPDKATDIKALLKERHMLLSQTVGELTQLYQGVKFDPAALFQAERDLLRATLELEEKWENRVALLQEGEKAAKRVLALAETYLKGGGGRRVDVLQAKAALLEFQIEILREKAKVKPGK